PGDTTPQVIRSTGGNSHAGPGGQRSSCRTAENITGDFFGRLAPRFTSFGAVAEEFYDAGEHVFVRGHYHAVSKSGEESDARFIHLWTVGGGKLTHLVQAADSHVVQQAANN
ncbi:nuclear transport factor 2 family protein, partial [Streptomyces sp. ATMOS53]